MSEFVSSALFVYTSETSHVAEELQENSHGVSITAVACDELLRDPGRVLRDFRHVVVSAAMVEIKAVLDLAREHKFSIGIVPLPSQRDLVRAYDLPVKTADAIELALQKDAQAIDLVMCNDQIMLHRAVVGRLPLLDSNRETGRFEMIMQAMKKLSGLSLLDFTFSSGDDKPLKTAACGCMVMQHQAGSLAARSLAQYSSVHDGMATLIISSPSSIIGYLKFLIHTLNIFGRRSTRLPSTVGYIKDSTIDIESAAELKVDIDGESSTQLPLHCAVIPEAVSLNVGEKLVERIRESGSVKAKTDTRNLPTGKDELAKALKKGIPFFAYASEERFRDLFLALRDDARLNGTFLVLMLLSTMLATVGLYQNSSAVVIGAMLLAPLMTPIVALAMGVLRHDQGMTSQSVVKISMGVLIALLAAALISQLFPYKPITAEMQARLNPTLLDLAVAILAGIAGAYTKAFKEILQSLAGVAIAVALVPPLAVAGIGIGRMEWIFFSQAFLLFLTNLIGIILAGSFTFRMLGYSAAVRNKFSLWLVMLAMVAICFPLYFSFRSIVETTALENSWKHERFLVNGKYLIVRNAVLTHLHERSILQIDLLARQSLSRADLTLFKQKIQSNFDRKLVVRANLIYIP